MNFTHNDKRYKLRFHYKRVEPSFNENYNPTVIPVDPFAFAFGPWNEVDVATKDLKTTSPKKLKAVHIQTITSLNEYDVDKDDFIPVAVGHATCVRGDQFSKATGRHTAMNNMVKNYDISRDMRITMGHTYNNCIKN